MTAFTIKVGRGPEGAITGEESTFGSVLLELTSLCTLPSSTSARTTSRSLRLRLFPALKDERGIRSTEAEGIAHCKPYFGWEALVADKVQRAFLVQFLDVRGRWRDLIT